MGLLDLFRRIGKKSEQGRGEPPSPVKDPAHEMAQVPAGEAEQPASAATIAATNAASDTAPNMASDESGFAHIWMVELLYRGKPILNLERLYSKMQEYTGPVQLQDREEENASHESGVYGFSGYSFEPLLFHHTNYIVPSKDGALPAQTCVLPPERSPEPAMYEAALQQSWHWPEARKVVGTCRHSLLLTDFCAAGLDYKDRLKLFHQALCALLETVPCEAIYWKTSGKIISPQQYLQAVAEGEALHGAMNVRLYKMVEEEGGGAPEMVVDTCGLAAMGLPDLQCHFTGLDPNDVAVMLMDLAYYLYEQGDVIQNGETIGTSESQRWRCERQHALIEPRRYVLDLDPGEPFCAGKHKHGESIG